MKWLALGLGLVLLAVRAGPTTAPASDDVSTPRGIAKYWNRRCADWNLDQMLQVFNANSDAEKRLARALAEQSLVVAKLQKDVRKQWGKSGETLVAHAALTDTVDDDDAAAEQLNGDHATLTFKDENLTPLFLIKSGGQWKIDIAAYIAAFNGDAAKLERLCRQANKSIEQLSSYFAAGKFESAQELASAITKAMDALEDSK